MKWLGTLATVTCGLFALAQGAVVPIKDPNSVAAVDLTAVNPHLTSANFTAATTQGTWFVKFYVGYCPHCKRLGPIWQKVADDLKALKASHNYHMGQVDCVTEGAFCNQQNIEGYPTLFVYRDGKPVEPEYLQPYKNIPITAYVKAMAEKYKSAVVVAPPVPADVPGTTSVEAPPATSAAASAPAPATTTADKTPAKPVGPYNKQGMSVPLTAANFGTLTKEGPWFIKFYAPWCIHCQHLAPTWESLAKSLVGEINVGEVDCVADGALCNDRGIAGYPTLRFYLEGSYTTFDGERSVESMHKFALESFGTQHKEVETRHELDKNTAGLETWYLYLFNAQAAPRYLETAQRAARATFMQSNFFTSQDASLLNGAFALPRTGAARATVPGLWVFKDGFLRPYSGALDNFDQVKTWMAAERYPLVPALTTQNADGFFDDADLVVLTVLDTDSRRVRAGQLEAWKREIRQAADDILVLRTGESALNPTSAVVRTGSSGVSDPAAAGSYHLSETRRKFLAGGQNIVDVPAGPEGDVVRALRAQRVRFVWLDVDVWDKYLHRVFGATRDGLPKVILSRPQDEVYFDHHADGRPLQLTSAQDLVDIVKAAVAEQLPARYSAGFLVGLVRSIFRSISRTTAYLFTHPMTFLFLLAVVGAVGYYYMKGGLPGQAYKPQKLD
ncbi:hypothetical protein IWQ60_000080 [Tieghemiomyces parasiticus]|uniref:Thioredoxin domain-containing protein n=1 Tax=Tieghemiomyces parasiticus TaxID=78921 RepID=A0A9W8DZI7_9FUNG|nr:hypothetical protein IWQ60_000080 [Tieghemiomyces parasiticus]